MCFNLHASSLYLLGTSPIIVLFPLCFPYVTMVRMKFGTIVLANVTRGTKTVIAIETIHNHTITENIIKLCNETTNSTEKIQSAIPARDSHVIIVAVSRSTMMYIMKEVVFGMVFLILVLKDVHCMSKSNKNLYK